MLKFSLGLLCAFYLVSHSVALFSREKVTDYCEYWQFSPMYEELDLDNKCTKAVYVNPKMVSLFYKTDFLSNLFLKSVTNFVILFYIFFYFSPPLFMLTLMVRIIDRGKKGFFLKEEGKERMKND